MNWNLEELIEDAIASYLRATLSGDARVYAAFTSDVIQQPCVIVAAVSSEPISENAQWHNQRSVSVQVGIKSEATPQKDGAGNIIRTAREYAAAIRSDVMNALAKTSLYTLLNAQGPDVLFSMAQVSSLQRSVEDRSFVTIINLETIAEPNT
jgi:hypothetical protein